MANMSEEWRQSIVEDEQSSADAKERNRRTQDALDKRRSSDYVPPAPKLPPAPPEASDSKPRDRSPGSSPTPPKYRGDRAIDRRSSTPSIKPPTKQNRSMGGGNGGSTIGTIERGKSGDGFLGPTVRIGGRRIGIPNPSPIR